MNQPMFQDLSLSRVPPDFRGRPKWFVQLWWLVQGSLFAWSPQVLYPWRSFLLRMFGAKIGKNVQVRPSAKVTYPWKLSISDHAWIGDNVVLYTLGEITIGANSVISQRSYICTGAHDYRKIGFDIYAIPIVVEDEVWVATDVFVAPGIKIGRGSVVGARSSVFSDIPPAVIARGYPARVIRPREPAASHP